MKKNPSLEMLLVDRTQSELGPTMRNVLTRARALVLNADYRPISVLPPSVIDWQEAITKVWNGLIDVVEVYDDIAIPSTAMTFRAPAVLRSRKMVKRKHEVHFSRLNVFMRDHYTCQYCGAKGMGVELAEANFRIRRRVELTYDHARPRSAGGKTEWENILTACTACNSEKGSKLNFRKPIRPPRRPSYAELASFAVQQPLTIPCEKWATYLGWKGPLFVHTPMDEQYAIVDLGHGNYSREHRETDVSSV